MANESPDRRIFARQLNRRRFLRSAFALTAGGAAWYALGCGSGDGDAGPAATATTGSGAMTPAGGTTPGASGGVRPVMLTSEFVADQGNRFAVGLIDGNGKLLRDADVNAKFYTLGEDGTTGTLRGEGALQFVELNVEGAHQHDSSAGEAVDEEAVAFYLANTPFDVAGSWAAELSAVPPAGGEPVSIRVPFQVREQSQSPGLQETPPESQNDTFETTANPDTLCSRVPRCPLHDKVIADVLGNGRPLVVQFSTPAFCQTRFCGPVLEILLKQVPQYQDRVDFVHIEVWKDFQSREYREAVTEWNLPGEPYTFFMNGDGKVVGKLESVFSDEELTSFLDQLVKL